jgi:hypothetical protein
MLWYDASGVFGPKRISGKASKKELSPRAVKLALHVVFSCAIAVFSSVISSSFRG